jgi:hypothetical protein
VNSMPADLTDADRATIAELAAEYPADSTCPAAALHPAPAGGSGLVDNTPIGPGPASL